MELPPAYEALQLEVERRLHSYLRVPADNIERIVIVGANTGDEVWRMHNSYPRARFLCFEPSPQHYNKLSENFCQTDFVESRRLALSDTSGTATFHELPLAGNGSLLPPDVERWAQFTQIDQREIRSFQVNASTLDKEAGHLGKIDLLWVDVQGAEGKVLRGGMETMRRVASVFLEVALVDSPYTGALLFPELDRMLRDFEFFCTGLGIDGWNYTGNALWLRRSFGRMAAHS